MVVLAVRLINLLCFQGYNRMIVFSRPSYFCLCACLILALHYGSLTWSRTVFTLYGAPFTVQGSLVFARDFVIGEYTLPVLCICVMVSVSKLTGMLQLCVIFYSSLDILV